MNTNLLSFEEGPSYPLYTDTPIMKESITALTHATTPPNHWSMLIQMIAQLKEPRYKLYYLFFCAGKRILLNYCKMKMICHMQKK